MFQSGLCAASEVGTPRGGSIRIQHVTAAAAAAASSAPGSHSVPFQSGSSLGDDAPARFPRLDECAHFHYDHVELGPLQVNIISDQNNFISVTELLFERQSVISNNLITLLFCMGVYCIILPCKIRNPVTQ